MPFKYHPPTRSHCPVCEELAKNKQSPIIKSEKGRASSANHYPIHNWYNFVLGYTPEFPEYILERENITSPQTVLDPFMGAGTTLVCCKYRGIPSIGIDANNFFFDVVQTKLDWSVDVELLKSEWSKLYTAIGEVYETIDFGNDQSGQLSFLSQNGHILVKNYAEQHRPTMLTQRYISDTPFAKVHLVKQMIEKKITAGPIRRLFQLALSSIIVPVSNVKYGPGFGVSKPKIDCDVFSIFREKMSRIISDMQQIPEHGLSTTTDVRLGDAREMSRYFAPNSVDLMITSPPYPGDHEYTKHTRLELILMGYATNLDEFRTIKKRMMRGSTTNVYKDDCERQYVKDFASIQKITELIDKRLKQDGATSGFEKLYTKLVWEYFGGMYLALREAYSILKEGGKFSLLVSDSHAFKMVHIRTAVILAELAHDLGYREMKIELWQDKISSSHKYHLREEILTLVK